MLEWHDCKTDPPVEPVIIRTKSGVNEPRWHMETMCLPPKERAKVRSKTFPGIAKAMAEQWTEYLMNNKEAQT